MLWFLNLFLSAYNKKHEKQSGESLYLWFYSVVILFSLYYAPMNNSYSVMSFLHSSFIEGVGQDFWALKLPQMNWKHSRTPLG